MTSISAATEPPVSRKLALSRIIFGYTVLGFLVIWPWYGDTFVLLGDANLALTYAIVAFSLVLLTGWVGQISLAHAAFVGIGAFVTAILVDGLSIGFPVSVLVGGGAAAGSATLLGLVALRVRGLYLAVATLIFAWMCDSYLFLTPTLGGGGGAVGVPNRTVGTEGAFPFFDFTNRRTFYYVALAVAAMVFYGLSNLRDSKTGRALFAVKGSEVAAASLGIDVTRYKLLAFALSGFVAGMAGSLIAIHAGALTATQFRFTVSFFYLAIAVVGGLQSLGGAIAAAVLFGALSDLFFRVPALNGYLELVSGLLLGAVLLAYPGGLAAVPGDLARWRRKVAAKTAGRRQALETAEDAEVAARAGMIDRLGRAAGLLVTPLRAGARGMRRASTGTARSVRWLVRTAARSDVATDGELGGEGTQPAQRLLSLEGIGLAEPGSEVHAAAGDQSPDDVEWLLDDFSIPARRPRKRRAKAILEADSITVRFGGLTAVNDVSLKVCDGEIVGLIGPNGAGKTTLFNAIAGLNRPTEGAVRIFGTDATRLGVHERARLGVGRTFQAIQLFRDLSVRENLLVATHAQDPTGFLRHITVAPAALIAEDASCALVDRIIAIMGLSDVADRPVEGLPFGTLRIVEVARALVTRSPLIMLDEPASGLDNAETDRLSHLLLALRERLGVTILLIEHDVRMVTSVCDFMYVIDRGNLIASGPTQTVQRDPAVIRAYLGSAPTEQSEELAGVTT